MGLFSLLVSCNTGISDRSLTFIMPDEFTRLLNDDDNSFLVKQKNVLIVDSRPAWSYRKGHVPKSINIPFGQLKQQMWQIDNAEIIIVVGETYNDAVAIAMSKTLIEYGFKDVRTLQGGITGWEDGENPISVNE